MQNIPWILLEPAHVADYLVSDQLTVLTHYHAQKSADPLKNIIKDTCAYIQNCVPESYHPNPIEPYHIPVACKTAACHLIIEALQSRLPELKLSDDQIRNAHQARKTLEDLFIYWKEQACSKQYFPRIESVHYRRRESHYSALKGL